MTIRTPNEADDVLDQEHEDHIERLRGIVREGFLNEIRLTDSRNAWRFAAIIQAIVLAFLLIGIFTR